MTDEQNDGGPAFPRAGSTDNAGVHWEPMNGMTLRDYHAAHAPPMSRQWEEDSMGDGIHVIDAQAAWNYRYADAMLAERSRERE